MRKENVRVVNYRHAMPAASARLLELLELLQSRRTWTGEELARRLGVSTRTIRTNIAQLRELGFPVEATPGAAGGYVLGAGARMAPLLLEDDEAIATAVALRTVTDTGVDGVEEAALRALAKLAQVLPDRLQRRVEALQQTIEPMRWHESRHAVDPEALAVLSMACRDRVQVRFDYVARGGAATRREVEPHTLVPAGSRWYLVAFDLDRNDWRTFRVDRTNDARPLRRRSQQRPLPAADAATYVRQSIRISRPRHQVVVRFSADRDTVQSVFDGHVPGELTADETGCLLATETESFDWFAFRLAMTDLDFTVVEPVSFSERLSEIAARFRMVQGIQP